MPGIACCADPEFFSMGLRLPDGVWLSVLSGWRRNRVTYVDLQMNDMHHKKESISAVMRAFMLEHEIALGQSRSTLSACDPPVVEKILSTIRTVHGK